MPGLKTCLARSSRGPHTFRLFALLAAIYASFAVQAQIATTSPGKLVASLNQVCATDVARVWCSSMNSISETGSMTPTEIEGLTGVTALAAGWDHICAITSGGGVSCWGDNRVGQLGDGTQTARSTPTAISGLTGVTALAAGHGHTCAITLSGQAWCWGLLIDKPRNHIATTPMLISGLTGATAVTAGYSFTCVIANGGRVWCWGDNSNGQFGDGTRVSSLQPVETIGISGAKALVAGYSHTCALTSIDGVKCWGNSLEQALDGDGEGKPSLPRVIGGVTGVTGLAAFIDDTCAINYDGGVSCWTVTNRNGVSGTTTPKTISGLSGVTGLAGNAAYVCALVGGSVWCKSNAGEDWKEGQSRPTLVLNVFSGEPALMAGGLQTCAVTGNDAVFCWGDNGTTSKTTPTVVLSLPAVVAVAPGNGYNCGIRSTGVSCWGRNDYGQLGNGSTTPQPTPVQAAISGLGVTQAVAAADRHACAITGSGEIRCWGENTYGQLGDGTTAQRMAPIAVNGLTGTRGVTAGTGHTCAITGSGGVSCWGNNASGQLGDGTTTARTTPTAVTGLAGVVALAAGAGHTCAVTSGGGVACWGDNSYGQLGDGTTTTRTTPTAVTGINGVVALAAGTGHTCALTGYGVVMCWGKNANGQLGDGTTASRLVPTGSIGYVKALTAGNDHTCAITSDGWVKCWGDNSAGQLGDGTKIQRPTPVAVLNIARTGALGYGFTPVIGGTLQAMSLAIDYTIAPADTGIDGNLFLAANVGTTLYLHDGRQWRRHDGGPMPAIRSGKLVSQRVPVETALDTQSMKGVTLYAGYGRNSAEMLKSVRYQLVYTINPE